jgi:hypothetical protein
MTRIQHLFAPGNLSSRGDKDTDINRENLPGLYADTEPRPSGAVFPK